MLNFSNSYTSFNEVRFLKRLRPLSEYSRVIHDDKFGRGVEATSIIPECSAIGIYPGQVKSIDTFLEKEEFINRSIKCCFLHPNNSIIDPTDIFGYLQDTPERRIALINEPINGERANVISVTSRKYIWYIAIREIKIGEQLFTNYGYSYKRDYEISESSKVSSSSNTYNFNKCELDNLKIASIKYSWLKNDLLALLRN